MTTDNTRAVELLRLEKMPRSLHQLASLTSQAWPEIRKDWGWPQVAAYQHLLRQLERRECD